MSALLRRIALPRTAYARAPVVFRLLSLLDLRRQRAHLARLDNHALRDIGLTRADAADEAARPVWDVPHNWRV